MADKIAICADTAAAWTANNPTLPLRQEGVETDTGRRKLGAATTPWTALPYLPNVVGGANLGSSGARLLSGEVAGIAQFRRLLAGSGLSVTENTNDVTINNTATGAATGFTMVVDVVRDHFANRLGTADCHIQINNAINAAAYGQTVFVPPGIYRIAASIKPKSGTRLVFSDGAVIRRNWDGGDWGGGMLEVGTSGNPISNVIVQGGEWQNPSNARTGRVVTSVEASRVTFDGLYVSSWKKQGTASQCMSFAEMTDFVVKNCWATGSPMFLTGGGDDLGDTCYRFTGCKRGHVFNCYGRAFDNPFDFTQTGQGPGFNVTQSDILVENIWADSKKGSLYGDGSAVILGIAGTQSESDGLIQNITFNNVTAITSGTGQPLFEVMNRSAPTNLPGGGVSAGTGIVRNIKVSGLRAYPADNPSNVFQVYGNGIIDGVFLDDSQIGGGTNFAVNIENGGGSMQATNIVLRNVTIRHSSSDVIRTYAGVTLDSCEILGIGATRTGILCEGPGPVVSTNTIYKGSTGATAIDLDTFANGSRIIINDFSGVTNKVIGSASKYMAGNWTGGSTFI